MTYSHGTLLSATLYCDPEFKITSCSNDFITLTKLPMEVVLGAPLVGGAFLWKNGQNEYLKEQQTPFYDALIKKIILSHQELTLQVMGGEATSDCMVTIQPLLDNQEQVSQLCVTLVCMKHAREKREGGKSFRRREDNLIRQAKDEWEKTFDAIQDVITILDNDLRIVRANRAAHELLGVPYGELTGKKCHEVFEGRDTKCLECHLPDDMSRTEMFQGLIHNKRFNKTFDVASAPIFDEAGNKRLIVHTARDITAQKKSKAERQLLSQAIEQASEVIVITDAGGNIEYVNPAFSTTTGYRRTEAIGQNPRILKSGHHDENFYREMWSTLLAGNVWSGRLVNRKKDGTFFHEDVSISPVTDADGEITNFVAVKRDTSKEDLLEQQLQQALKMEAIGTLAGGIAHDFNNILAAMIGYGQIIKGRLSDEDASHADIDQILQAGDRAVDLVKQILTFSRKDTQYGFQPLKVGLLLKEVLRMMRSSLPATIDLVSEIDDECGFVLADSSQIHQVIMNLFTNGKQAIGDAYGRIQVNLSEIEVGLEREGEKIPPLKPGKYLHLEVGDTGKGMDHHTQQRIFDPFFTTKSKEHGSGLGLAVVHGIVRNHGGEITVESEVGIGSVFRVFLPLTTLEVAFDDVSNQPLYRGSERIMVVDDEAVVGRVIANMLTKMGYEVTVFSSSLEAVCSFRRNPHDYDLIFTDMTMPDMTGAELASEALAMRADMPVILATGFSEAIDKKKSDRIGIKEFMMKPIKRKHLSKVVRKVLDNGRNSNN